MPQVSNSTEYKGLIVDLSKKHFRLSQLQGDCSTRWSLGRLWRWLWGTMNNREIVLLHRAIKTLNNLHQHYYDASLANDQQFNCAVDKLHQRLDKLTQRACRHINVGDPRFARLINVIKDLESASLFSKDDAPASPAIDDPSDDDVEPIDIVIDDDIADTVRNDPAVACLSDVELDKLVELHQRSTDVLNAYAAGKTPSSKDANALIADIGKLNNALKKRAKNNDQERDDLNICRDLLRELRTALLKVCLKDALKEQSFQVKTMKQHLNNATGLFDDAERFFLSNIVELWESQLAKGKLVAIPKWYHCTKDMGAHKDIINSCVKAIFGPHTCGGAYVSNQPEIPSYGQYAVALSRRIENLGANHGQKPLCTNSLGSSYLVHGKGLQVAQQATNPNGPDKQQHVNFWYGLPKDIPLARPDKKSNPLGYYKDFVVGFVAAPDHQVTVAEDFLKDDSVNAPDASVVKGPAKGIDKNIWVVSHSELQALRKLYTHCFALDVPGHWPTS